MRLKPEPGADTADIAVYPPLLAIATPLAAVALEFMAPLGLLGPAFAGWQAVIGGLICVVAGMLGVGGILAFKEAGTNVDPHAPSLRLTTAGPYRLTRNPMYLGMVVLQAGLGFLCALDWSLVLMAPLWAALHFGVVLREEAYLTRKFGAPYTAYLGQTRRWL